MKKEYYKKYIDQINFGLLNSSFLVEGKPISPDLFFKKIKDLMNHLRLNKHKIFFLEMAPAPHLRITWLWTFLKMEKSYQGV